MRRRLQRSILPQGENCQPSISSERAHTPRFIELVRGRRTLLSPVGRAGTAAARLSLLEPLARSGGPRAQQSFPAPVHHGSGRTSLCGTAISKRCLAVS
ncbi:hypothetical protein NDU88_005183 [Pleurodeles waltl]|uniref:Uncharacterized protein n=1 Tax=Pleurodeles waltl TaxID=8319 RepID=A0AAV7RK82_PLEWA|nr:hypothetical protein NDU88_005183 [Pleurodeles waltl]